ncbi:MAG TPA: AraC family transcriptional regulator [Polyangiaceae bacterium]|nr:AraC family transcriptional regulator [Polyangiaceae bacterium]
MSRGPRSASEADLWRRRSFDVQASEVVAGRGPGPEPPRAWAGRLSKLIEASRQLREGPSWWTPVDAYFGSVETRAEPHSYYWDGMKRIGRRDRPLVFFQFTFAGFGQFELYGRPPQRIGPGTGFFAVIPSRHRYYLPEASPGWTFAWIGIYHPYLLRRIAKQVATSGPVLEAPPASPFVARLLRLVRGAFHKDFRDRFEVERELFEFTLAYEQLVQKVRGPEGERLLDELRSRVLADPRRPLELEVLAAERDMSQSAFSHFFRARTGLTPARFMTEVRVQEAARLLVSTRLPIERIAHDCGFANGNHFGKVFRRFRHQSASSYRRSVG